MCEEAYRIFNLPQEDAAVVLAHKSYGCRGQSKLYDAIRSQCCGTR